MKFDTGKHREFGGGKDAGVDDHVDKLMLNV